MEWFSFDFSVQGLACPLRPVNASSKEGKEWRGRKLLLKGEGAEITSFDARNGEDLAIQKKNSSSISTAVYKTT